MHKCLQQKDIGSPLLTVSNVTTTKVDITKFYYQVCRVIKQVHKL